jgi:hypothetical protein
MPQEMCHIILNTSIRAKESPISSFLMTSAEISWREGLGSVTFRIIYKHYIEYAR